MKTLGNETSGTGIRASSACKCYFTTQFLLYYQADYDDVFNYVTTTSPLTKLSCTSLLSDSWTGSPVRYDSSHAAATADTFNASDFETEIFSLPDIQTSSAQSIDTDDRIPLRKYTRVGLQQL